MLFFSLKRLIGVWSGQNLIYKKSTTNPDIYELYKLNKEYGGPYTLGEKCENDFIFENHSETGISFFYEEEKAALAECFGEFSIVYNGKSELTGNPVSGMGEKFLNKIGLAHYDGKIKQEIDSKVGNLAQLATTNKSDLVSAINEVDFTVKGLGEPFRVINWASNTLNVTIVPCTSDTANTSLAKMIFTIDNETGAEYQIVGMIAYEVFDAETGGNRINCWPVCQFTGNGQKELSVRWMCGGTTNKTAKRINAWVLLKHR